MTTTSHSHLGSSAKFLRHKNLEDLPDKQPEPNVDSEYTSVDNSAADEGSVEVSVTASMRLKDSEIPKPPPVKPVLDKTAERRLVKVEIDIKSVKFRLNCDKVITECDIPALLLVFSCDGSNPEFIPAKDSDFRVTVFSGGGEPQVSYLVRYLGGCFSLTPVEKAMILFIHDNQK
jgi:hypothetical protein